MYDLSTALEPDWYEDLGLCPPGGAVEPLRDGATSPGGIPVDPSGGLPSSFGEAAPAQALAHACELNWRWRGLPGPRQVSGARVGVTANQALSGHGSSVVVIR